MAEKRSKKLKKIIEEETSSASDDGSDDASDAWEPVPEDSKKAVLGKRKSATKTPAGKKQSKEVACGIKLKPPKKANPDDPAADPRHFPNRQGIFSLYAYKGDLKNGLRANTKIALWRRETRYLLQKYVRDNDSSGNSIYFDSSLGYWCVYDNEDDFLEVRVRVISNNPNVPARDTKVELLAVDEIEKKCLDGRFGELDLVPYKSHVDKET